MRIVCPICGEEPKKGQRHFCKPAEAPRQQLELELGAGAATTNKGGSESVLGMGSESLGHNGTLGVGGITRRGIANATSGGVCASMASLVSKSPKLWRSGGALARCGSEDFVAGLLAMAVGLPCWQKDPKRALVSALLGRVAHEAARALQDFWRRILKSRAPQRRTKGVSDGYQQLVLASSATRGSARPALADRRAPSRDRPGKPPALSSVSTAAAQSVAMPSPRQPETPRNKSNPRPCGGKAVPVNPIQALKHRKMQQHQEAEERRLQQLHEAEARRAAARAAALGTRGGSSQPPSPSVGETHSRCLLPPGPGSDGDWSPGNICEAPFRPSTPSTPEPQPQAERLPPYLPVCTAEGVEAGRQLRNFRQQPPSPRASDRGGPLPNAIDGQVSSAPPTMNGWRPSTAREEAQYPPRSSSSASGQSPSATDRLRERMAMRATQPPAAAEVGASERSRIGTGAVLAGGAGLGWRDRIEMRQRETEEIQVLEEEHKNKVNERSCRRNDAMRRVMERQAERQQDVEQLES